MTWTVTAVPPEEVNSIWPEIRGLLAPAVKRSGGRVTLLTLLGALRERRSLLWLTYPEDRRVRAAFVTRIAQYPARRLVSVDFAGGEAMDEWVNDVQATFRRYAADAGCSGVEMSGRAGWGKVLGRYGWTPDFVVLTADAIADGAPT